MQQILSTKEIFQKLNRIAFQILENTTEESKVYIAGICGNGLIIANYLKKLLSENSTQEFIVFEIKLNKNAPLNEKIETQIDLEKIKNSYFILVDDVLNSGKTMQYALIKLLEIPTKAIKTVALVDRKHRRYPIKCDYVGLSLSTTLKNHVEVIYENEQFTAYLV